jgi:hypothetical protein
MENEHYIIFFLLILFFYLFCTSKTKTEKYGGGALTQLISKGPQDINLTINTEKYMDPYYNEWGVYPRSWMNFPRYKWHTNITPFIWNNGTRLNGYYSYTYPYMSNYFYPRVAYY